MFVDECGDAFPVSKDAIDGAFAKWPVLRLEIPGLEEALMRDSPRRKQLEAAIGPYFKRIPGYEKEIECSGRLEAIRQSRPTLLGDAARLPDNVLDRYERRWTAVSVTPKARTVPIPPQRPPYFVKLDAPYGVRGEIRAVLGESEFQGQTSIYGPTTAELPREMTLIWKLRGGEERRRTLDLTRGVPPKFNRLTIALTANGDVEVVFEMGDRMRGPWSRIPYGETPEQAKRRELGEALWHAANFGRIEEVKELLSKGADIDFARDALEPSVLRVAFNARRMEVVDYLLAQGARMRKVDWREPQLAEKASANGQKPE